MLDILYSLLSFIVAITILVAIHEYGHYWVAKISGVKVLRYSIGFGKPLYKKNFGRDNTEFVIAAIPLGGYVKMLDEREAEVPAADLERAFNRQHVAKRFAIVFAGPLFNFIFAIFAYWLMFVNGTPGIVPVVGEVVKDSPAAIAGMRSGDTIISINNVETPIWDVVLNEFVPVIIEKSSVSVVVKTDMGLRTELQFDFSSLTVDLESGNILAILGFEPWRPVVSAKIGAVIADFPAEKAGLQKGDIILKVNDVSVLTWLEMAKEISSRPSERIELTVDSAGKVHQIFVETKEDIRKGKKVGIIGISNAAAYPDEMKRNYQYSVFGSITKAVSTTWTMTNRTLSFLYKMVKGEVSLKNISGPITIAKYAGLSADAGLSKFLGFLAIVSISLGVLNLLPVPMLDGGHLFYYLIEIVKGSPVSVAFEAIGQQIGIVLLLLLMSLAFYNDLLRLFG
ncbi:Intramembrane protease RasP/YluC, implicated in cell division based on FtsL cleavage [hydrothermal vent metagenome]|uniref:Intramembrane protease RasP/YluC, implicated in cell division based on FtsL cleavage n=1 Tax=hydrothermal vent metagenome TaxID=652676 RepID=A0A3B1A0U1_9ZZZZ